MNEPREKVGVGDVVRLDPTANGVFRNPLNRFWHESEEAHAFLVTGLIKDADGIHPDKIHPDNLPLVDHDKLINLSTGEPLRSNDFKQRTSASQLWFRKDEFLTACRKAIIAEEKPKPPLDTP